MSTKEELMLDIMEKTYDKVEKLSESVHEIKNEQVRQNVIVERHEARSTASEVRMTWIENQILMINASVKIIGTIGAVILFFVKILPYLSSHL